MSDEIPISEVRDRWLADPEVATAYAALQIERAIANQLLGARAASGLTQQQVAERMGTTQAVIARLESGRQMPSTRTMQRYAEATGTTLRISFEPRN